ncbi:NAD-dependent malic enzyme [Bythopirellula goksoeyrii]|uniref:NAD-dependent malic enzyme n=1 Tax=Bythopirellula goksoeyrii TaxID=1400387 RepID=A0A5B9QE06_9BACT|nr:NAD-dependent malic enzyme [Bythopirellula goksoeyrii]QEG37198.1 NAD-dependent malic enzyme [Bythopirellula goksoeyrii]
MTSPVLSDPEKTGIDRIEDPLLNKGTAFTPEERQKYRLLGLLPPHIDSLEEQVVRAYDAFSAEETDLDKHIFLRELQDENETLFYRLLLEHVAEMMPIVYTPIVGKACEEFSHIYRRARGVFVSYPDRELMDDILSHVDREIDVIVVTDGERILGLGDQGAGGMGIPIGKLSLYSLCGGIHPARTLPMLLDLGTNNAERIDDPRYIGWRHERIKGAEYDNFIEQFVEAVMKRFPNVLLQWEDFASVDAERILKKYRDRLCTFNDDIQGTAAVTSGTILAAIQSAGGKLADQRFVMLGAGSAGVGITGQLVGSIVASGKSEAEARDMFYVIDRNGLLHDGRTDLDEVLMPLAQKQANLAGWDCDTKGSISFADVVRNAKPTVLVGATGQQGAFTEAIIREMASHTERPVIFPLSNPTSHAEAIPADLLKWTDGKARIATGSPFDPVEYNGKTHVISQCNNSYIFPAMGLGILAAKANRVTDGMFTAAAEALKECSPALADPTAPLLPPLSKIRDCARHIGIAVARQAQQDGVAQTTVAEELEKRIDQTMWTPQY